MMLSLFLAKLIGLSIVVIVGAFFIRRKDIDLLFSIYKHPEVVFLTGMVETVLGLSIVLAHNIWVMDYRVVITLIGWSLLLRGIARMLAPDAVARALEKVKKMRSLLTPLLVLVFLFGAYLVYVGFTG